MSSGIIYNSALFDMASGAVDFDSDVFYVMLVDATYTPDKRAHSKRADVSGEVAATGGYTTGGVASSVAVALDNVNDRLEITLGAAAWPMSTITARGAVYYKRTGGAPSADELIAYIGFGANIVSTAGQFSLTQSLLRINN